MKLDQLFQREVTFLLGPIGSRDEMLSELSRRIAEQVNGIDAQRLNDALIEREQRGVTSTPEGVAFPHAMLDGLKDNFIAAALVKGGVNMGRKEHPPSDVVFVLVGPPDSAWEHVRVLARLARICHTPGALDHLRSATSPQELFDRLMAEDARHV